MRKEIIMSRGKANGYAKISDINDGSIGKCAVHDTKIEELKNDQNNLGKKIDTNRTEVYATIAEMKDDLKWGRRFLISNLVVWIVALISGIAIYFMKGGTP